MRSIFKIKRIRICNSDIFIDKRGLFGKKAEEYLGVLIFQVSVPIINVFENNKLIRTFNIETRFENPDLKGQYFHFSIRILANEVVMIDGVISKDMNQEPKQDINYEAIRFQPFYLSTVPNNLTKELIGKGLFKRGIHYSGIITPMTVRVICICDNCTKSFTVQHFHGGFSESQYFYSDDGKQTLVVSYSEIENIPTQLQKEIDETTIVEIEAKLPHPTKGTGRYRYYNSFKCPFCYNPFIDFQTNKQIRPTEYYGLKFINQEFQTISSDKET